jgi:16S rRNA (uracil1498-N3)-methyltransferase
LKTRRIIITPDELGPDGIRFSPENAKYLRKVLRLKSGDRVVAFDGVSEHTVSLSFVSGEAKGDLVDSAPKKDPKGPAITLAFGCVRPGPFQETLRHGTELGVTRFTPLITVRTTRKPDKNPEAKRTRWESIIASALSQSGRTDMPVIEAPVPFGSFIERDHGHAIKFVFSTSKGAVPLSDALSDTEEADFILLVGPEGGFDPEEEIAAINKGFKPARLVEHVLRTETACVTAVGIIASRRRPRSS